jgi:hypothetical protein
MEIRKPAFAGRFYPSDFDQLTEALKGYLEQKEILTTEVDKSKLYPMFGAIVPHAGYMFSGQCAAYAYKEISYRKQPDIFIFIGPNHTGNGSGIAVTDEDKWRTPLGDAIVNRDFANTLWEASDIIDMDSYSHKFEHSIEVQIPFLQFLYNNQFSFVPINMQGMFYDNELCKKLGHAIAETCKLMKLRPIIIATSDFTHYGPSYGYTVKGIKGKKPQQIVEEYDKKLITFATKLKAEDFLKYAASTTVCGSGPISAALYAMKELGSKSGKLLEFTNSGEVVGDYDNYVNYASIAFE